MCIVANVFFFANVFDTLLAPDVDERVLSVSAIHISRCFCSCCGTVVMFMFFILFAPSTPGVWCFAVGEAQLLVFFERETYEALEEGGEGRLEDPKNYSLLLSLCPTSRLPRVGRHPNLHASSQRPTPACRTPPFFRS